MPTLTSIIKTSGRMGEAPVDTILEWSYPTNESTITIDMMHVRVVDNVRLRFDFEAHEWVAEQELQAQSDHDPATGIWVEVARWPGNAPTAVERTHQSEPAMGQLRELRAMRDHNSLPMLRDYGDFSRLMLGHKADAECGGCDYHSYMSSKDGALVCVDVTDLAIAAASMRPCIDYSMRMVEDAIWWVIAGRWAGPAESVCSVGDSKGEAWVGCQE